MQNSAIIILNLAARTMSYQKKKKKITNSEFFSLIYFDEHVTK